MAPTYTALLLQNMNLTERRLAEDHVRLARRTAEVMLTHEQSDGTLPNRKTVKAQISQNVWEQVLEPYYIGHYKGLPGPPGIDPQAPFVRTVMQGVENATYIQVQRQVALVKQVVQDPALVEWLTGPPPPNVVNVMQAAQASQAQATTPTPPAPGRFDYLRNTDDGRIDFARARADLVRPRGAYDPNHRYVSATGYRLADSVWNAADTTRERIDRLMDYHISRGTAAVDIAKELEQFLTPGAAGMKTTRPYGREGSYAARRLARTEITAAAHRATVQAASVNPVVTGIQWRLSGSHPKYDICDEYARGGPNGDGIYPIAQVPQVPHPHCLCTQIAVSATSRDDLVEQMRQEIGAARDQLLQVIDPDGKTMLQGLLNPDFLTQALMQGKLESAVGKAVQVEMNYLQSRVPAPAQRPISVLPPRPAPPRRVTLQPNVTTGATSPEFVGDVVVFKKGDLHADPQPTIHGIPLTAQGELDWAAQPDNTTFVEPPLNSQGLKVSTGIIMVEDDGRIWIVEPTGHYGGYEHTFPKGGMEPGLTRQQGARKETWEETGMHAQIVGYVGDAKGSTSMTRYYLGKRTGGDPLAMGWESQSVKLVTLDEAEKLLNTQRDQETLAVLRDLLQKDGIPLAGTSPDVVAPAVPPVTPVMPAGAPTANQQPFLPNTPLKVQQRLLTVERAMRQDIEAQTYIINRRGKVLLHDNRNMYIDADSRQVRDQMQGAIITYTKYGNLHDSVIEDDAVSLALLDGASEVRSTGEKYTYAVRFHKDVWGDVSFAQRVNAFMNDAHALVRDEVYGDPALNTLTLDEQRDIIRHRLMERLAGRFNAIQYARFDNPPDDVKVTSPTKRTRTPKAATPPPIAAPTIPARPGFLAGGFPDDLSRLVETRRLGGSTGAVQMRDPLDGRLYVMKRGASADHLRAEVAADQAYQLLGVNVPGLHLYETKGGPVKLAEWVDGTLLGELRSQDPARFATARRELQKDLAVDAVFMAWDVVGTGFDNILVDKDGKVWRIDNGGSFTYRAQGGIKPQATQNKWLDEIWSMRDRQVNQYAGEVFGDTDYALIGRRLADIGARQKEILALLPKEIRPLMQERLAMAADYGQIAVPFLDDQWKSARVESFTQTSIHIRRHTDLLEKLPGKMQGKKGAKGRSRVNVEDENGKRWDNLRDSDGKSSLVSKVAAHMSANGMDYSIIEEWASAQASDSWRSKPQAFKYHLVQERDKDPATTYWWKEGYDVAKQKYEAEIAKHGEEKYRRTWEFWRVINYEFLRNVDFKYNDRDRGLVYLTRTEKKSVMDMHNMKAGKTSKMQRGASESTSIYDTVFVHGTETTRQHVPHHRIFGNYMFDRGPKRNQALFIGDHENEFVAMLDDLDVDYIGSHKGI